MRYSIKAGAVLVVVAIAACSESGVTSLMKPGSAVFAKAPKVTICHAAGLAGTTHYIAITLSANGLNGHFLNNGTPKAGHETDFIASEERPCNAPEAAQVRICKVSGALSPENADPDLAFPFKRDFGGDFSLKFKGCTETFDVDPGQHTLTEPYDQNLPKDYSYFAVDVIVTGGGSLISKSGFFDFRPLIGPFVDAVAVVDLPSGQLTTITVVNRN